MKKNKKRQVEAYKNNSIENNFINPSTKENMNVETKKNIMIENKNLKSKNMENVVDGTESSKKMYFKNISRGHFFAIIKSEEKKCKEYKEYELDKFEKELSVDPYRCMIIKIDENSNEIVTYEDLIEYEGGTSGYILFDKDYYDFMQVNYYFNYCINDSLNFQSIINEITRALPGNISRDMIKENGISNWAIYEMINTKLQIELDL